MMKTDISFFLLFFLFLLSFSCCQVSYENIKFSKLLSSLKKITTNDEEDYLLSIPNLGTLNGRRSEKGNYRSFKSVPYASANRFEDSVMINNFNSPVIDATKFGPMCPQICSLPMGLCASSMSEDCLTINIYTPNNATNPLPVMVFIPGGHFDMGTANCDLYEGSYFVSKGNVVLVTMNYRLGALGYLVDKKRNINGNFALRDQRTALQWVQKYIKYFGGDASSVTLVGESAGAGSATALLLNPGSKGLFQKIILQSNPLSLHFRTVSGLNDLSDTFISKVGCSKDKSTNCLKEVDINTIVKYSDEVENSISITHPLTMFMPWTPVIDGVELFEQPLDAFANGHFPQMPMIMGTCADEGVMFVYLALSSSINSLEYNAGALAIFHFDGVKVLGRYKSQSGDNRPILASLATDYVFTAPTRNALESITKYQNYPVYLYQFNHSLSFGNEAWNPKYPFCIGKVCHGSEMPFLFNSPQFMNIQMTSNEEVLSNSIISYWTNFVQTGNPNVGYNKVDVNWSTWNSTQLWSMEFTTPKNYMTRDLKKKESDFWDSLGYNFGYGGEK
ncbi:hypothetical protein ABK040_004422 [Willaertia magna]